MNQAKISAALGDSLKDVIGHRHISNSDLEIFKDNLAEAVKENLKLKKIEESLRGHINKINSDLAKSHPSKIFICEDEGMVKTWENLFEKAKIESVKIETSKGKDRDCFEVALLSLNSKKLLKDYNPMIFRQFDRDGLTNEQVEKLESLIPNKFSKLRNYKVKFLPVCEVENFMVLKKQEEGCDFAGKTEDQITQLEDKIHGKIKGALELGNRVVKKNDNAGDAYKIFNSAEQRMLNEARSNRNQYYPGKMILNFFDTKLRIENLKNYSYEEFPALLKEYLSEIKNFFDKNESGSQLPI